MGRIKPVGQDPAIPLPKTVESQPTGRECQGRVLLEGHHVRGKTLIIFECFPLTSLYDGPLPIFFEEIGYY
jgi:hypothetical protein